MTPTTLRLTALVLRLDHEAVRLCGLLADAAIPHLLLKGPALQQWLYPTELRPYGDIDLLVPRSRQVQALSLLAGQGYTDVDFEVSPLETAGHARTLVAGDGLTVDLHTRLHSTTAGGDVVWQVLSEGAQHLALAAGTVPVCAVVPQLLVVVLHAAQHGSTETKPLEDLHRAALVATDAQFHLAAGLAARSGAAGSFAAGLRLHPGLVARLPQLIEAPRNLLVRARAGGGRDVPGVLVLARVRSAGWRRGLPIALRAAWPTRAFLQTGIDPAVSRRRGWVLRARLGRAGYQAQRTSAAVRALWALRRGG